MLQHKKMLQYKEKLQYKEMLQYHGMQTHFRARSNAAKAHFNKLKNLCFIPSSIKSNNKGRCCYVNIRKWSVECLLPEQPSKKQQNKRETNTYTAKTSSQNPLYLRNYTKTLEEPSKMADGNLFTTCSSLPYSPASKTARLDCPTGKQLDGKNIFNKNVL